MAYTKQNFTDGTVLHDYHLNNMENQIYDNAENIEANMAAIATKLEIVDATSADFDMDTILTSGAHCKIYKTGINTLGTPYSVVDESGEHILTTYTGAYILSVTTGNYGTQIAYSIGNYTTFIRRLKKGDIGDWVRIHDSYKAISIADGGTGATTAADALANLGAASESWVTSQIQAAIDATWEAKY